MTVFSLLVYSCVTFNAPMSGELLQKTCNWSGGGSRLYARLEACEADGNKLLGTPIFSDVADGRRVESTKCQPLNIVQ